jgi:hypothetical protein
VLLPEGETEFGFEEGRRKKERTCKDGETAPTTQQLKGSADRDDASADSAALCEGGTSLAKRKPMFGRAGNEGRRSRATVSIGPRRA